MRRIVQEQREAWLTSAVPAPGGRTPMEGVHDPNGRKMAEALLIQFEWDEERARPAAPRTGFSYLRRKLGLSARPVGA